jgi:small-conductance mechanosensitive channel
VPLGAWGSTIATFLGSLLLIETLFRVSRRLASRKRLGVAYQLFSRTRRALRALAVSVAGAESVRFAAVHWRAGLRELAVLAIIFSVAWLAIAASGVLAETVVGRFDTSVVDNRRARKIHTQISVLRRVLIVAIVVFSGLAGLTSFAQGRAIAASILASAGVIGLVAGIAGQSTIGNLIAGVQLAFSDALRLDDVVVVNGEWGTIEEITLTYVVVAVWDQRRLVLPASTFVTAPFENWTRTNSQLLGSVVVYADYAVPVDEVRRALLDFVTTQPEWDHRVAALQVVDATERTIQLRALVSAQSSSQAWNLRCNVREHLITYLRDHQPSSLPRTRLELAPFQQGGDRTVADRAEPGSRGR